nr:MAG TPA: hypothetical protein [Caudoviricetes sp.]
MPRLTNHHKSFFRRAYILLLLLSIYQRMIYYRQPCSLRYWLYLPRRVPRTSPFSRTSSNFQTKCICLSCRSCEPSSLSLINCSVSYM